jgi:hypothetical protein
MVNSGREYGMTPELRRHLRVRVLAPFACSFVRIGLQGGWLLNVPDWASTRCFVEWCESHEPGLHELRRSAWD